MFLENDCQSGRFEIEGSLGPYNDFIINKETNCQLKVELGTGDNRVFSGTRDDYYSIELDRGKDIIIDKGGQNIVYVQLEPCLRFKDVRIDQIEDGYKIYTQPTQDDNQGRSFEFKFGTRSRRRRSGDSVQFFISDETDRAIIFKPLPNPSEGSSLSDLFGFSLRHYYKRVKGSPDDSQYSPIIDSVRVPQTNYFKTLSQERQLVYGWIGDNIVYVNLPDNVGFADVRISYRAEADGYYLLDSNTDAKLLDFIFYKEESDEDKIKYIIRKSTGKEIEFKFLPRPAKLTKEMINSLGYDINLYYIIYSQDSDNELVRDLIKSLKRPLAVYTEILAERDKTINGVAGDSKVYVALPEEVTLEDVHIEMKPDQNGYIISTGHVSPTRRIEFVFPNEVSNSDQGFNEDRAKFIITQGNGKEIHFKFLQRPKHGTPEKTYIGNLLSTYFETFEEDPQRRNVRYLIEAIKYPRNTVFAELREGKLSTVNGEAGENVLNIRLSSKVLLNDVKITNNGKYDTYFVYALTDNVGVVKFVFSQPWRHDDKVQFIISESGGRQIRFKFLAAPMYLTDEKQHLDHWLSTYRRKFLINPEMPMVKYLIEDVQ